MLRKIKKIIKFSKEQTTKIEILKLENTIIKFKTCTANINSRVNN